MDYLMLAEPQIVFENAAIRVVFLPGRADRLLITFGDAADLAEDAQFFAQPVARAQGWPCLGFMAKDAHWYPESEIEASLPDLRYTLGSFAEKIIYGCSMGAYAAIKYSARLGARQVIAYCPQFSIDPAELHGARSGYDGHFRPALRGMGIRPGDIAGQINLFFDPYETVDARHARLIAAVAPDARLFHVANVGHHLAPVLAGSALTQGIFQACADGDRGRVYALINGARRASPWRHHYVLERGVRRHAVLTARALRGLLARNALVIHDSASLAPVLFDALVRAGETDLAHAVLRKLQPVMPSPRATLIARDLEKLAGGEPWVSAGLLTAHDTVLVYDAVRARFAHLAPARDRIGMVGKHRVVVCRTDDASLLAVPVGEALFACCKGQDGEAVALRPATAVAPGECFTVRETGARSVRVTDGANFLHATPDGGVHFACSGQAMWQRLIPV